MKHAILLLISCALLSLHAQQTKMVEWISPATAANKPQTPQDEEKGRQSGRAEPPPEILQPSLDSSLPSYHKRTDIEISGEFKAACSDVLPRLVKLWIAGFEKYYPKVRSVFPHRMPVASARRSS